MRVSAAEKTKEIDSLLLLGCENCKVYKSDNPDVDLVCTICAPPDIKSEYNNLLAEIASNLQCPQQRQRLRSAATNRDLYNDFIQHR